MKKNGKYIVDANWCVIFFSELFPGVTFLVLCGEKKLSFMEHVAVNEICSKYSVLNRFSA